MTPETNAPPPAVRRRFGQVTRLRPGHEEAYISAHAQVPQELLDGLSAAGIEDYSIFRWGDVLFQTFAYVGSDFERDMRSLGATPGSSAWVTAMAEHQDPVGEADPDSTWWEMPEVFRLD